MNAEAIEPVKFANMGEAFEKTASDELAELLEHAQEQVEQDTDPRNHQYIMRLDKKRLVKSEKEFASCQAKGIPLRYGISYGHALTLLSEEGAKNTAKAKRRKKNKLARKARKVNQKR